MTNILIALTCSRCGHVGQVAADYILRSTRYRCAGCSRDIDIDPDQRRDLRALLRNARRIETAHRSAVNAATGAAEPEHPDRVHPIASPANDPRGVDIRRSRTVTRSIHGYGKES